MKNYIGLLVFFTFLSIDLKAQSQDIIYPSVYDASIESSNPDLKNL